jgi:hypothetical protein
MKKLIIFISLLVTWIYLSNAISITLNSRQKLESSQWTDLSSTLNKVNVSGNNLSVNGKFSINWKICLADNNCLWECWDWYHWDTSSNSCITNAWTESAPWTSCLDLYNKWAREDKAYYLTWASGKKFLVYCDMTTAWGGWTLVAKTWHAHHAWSWRAAPTSESELIKYSRITPETTSWTLVDEFSWISTYIRYKLPFLDQYIAISDLSENSNRVMLVNRVSNSKITSISWSVHNRIALRFLTDDISKVYDYTLSYQPPTYGRRGWYYSTETWPAYVFLR